MLAMNETQAATKRRRLTTMAVRRSDHARLARIAKGIHGATKVGVVSMLIEHWERSTDESRAATMMRKETA